MTIAYIASHNKHSVSADTPHEAVRLFLAQFKDRTFGVYEYKDGWHNAVIHLDSGTVTGCYANRFRSRAEARAYLEGKNATNSL